MNYTFHSGPRKSTPLQPPPARANSPDGRAMPGETLSEWLRRQKLEDLAQPLANEGVLTLEDASFAAQEGLLTAEQLITNQGVNKIRAKRFIQLVQNSL